MPRNEAEHSSENLEEWEQSSGSRSLRVTVEQYRQDCAPRPMDLPQVQTKTVERALQEAEDYHKSHFAL